MLMISNDVVKQVLTMRECIESQEAAFAGLLEGKAICRPRIDTYTPCDREDGYSRWGTVDGACDGVLAVRLCLVNIGAAIPGTGDMATHGTPAKFSFCVRENEEASPWEPLHVELGFPKEATTVTCLAAEGPHNINDHESITAEGILTMIAGTMTTTGSNNPYYAGMPCVAFGPEHAQTIAGDGLSKADAKQWLFEHATLPLSRFSKETIERRFRRKQADQYGNAPLDAPVQIFQKPEDLVIIVTGGAGKHSAFIPTFGNTRAVTRVLKRGDDELVKSIHELKRG